MSNIRNIVNYPAIILLPLKINLISIIEGKLVLHLVNKTIQFQARQ